MTFVAEAPMTALDFEALARERGATPFRAVKIAPVAARRVDAPSRLETRWNGPETVKALSAGDWIVTALDERGAPLLDDAGEMNQYAISAATFSAKYAPGEADGVTETHYGRIYRQTATVTAIRLEDGFDIAASWGERQRADRGYLILSGDKVYGNHADTFEATYRRLDD